MSIGRSKAHPQSVALSVFQFCFARDISLKSQWIPRSLNEKAGHSCIRVACERALIGLHSLLFEFFDACVCAYLVRVFGLSWPIFLVWTVFLA